MKQIVCEMCEGTQFLKDNGILTCQTCGMKYSVEEAKKLMVEVEGTSATPAPTDAPSQADADECANLLQLARRAKSSGNNENAAKYYDMLLVKDPNSWEAYYFAIYYKSMSCKIANIVSAIGNVENCTEETFRLIRANVSNDEERVAAVSEIIEKNNYISDLMSKAYENHYNGIAASIKSNYLTEYLSVTVATATAKAKAYACLITYFEDDEYLMLNYGQKTLKDFLKGREKWQHADDARRIIKKYDAVIKAKQKEEAKRKAREAQERFDAYWAEHAADKEALESEKKEIESKMAALNQEIENIIKEARPQIAELEKKKSETLPEEKSLKEQQALIFELQTTLAGLGLFKGKEKKAIKARLEGTEYPKLNELKTQLKRAQDAHTRKINNEINALKKKADAPKAEILKLDARKAEIDNELIMPR